MIEPGTLVVRTFLDRAEGLSHFFLRAGEAPRLIAYDDVAGCPVETALGALEWTGAVGILPDDDQVHAARLTTETAAAVFNTLFPSGVASTWRCDNATLRGRFSFVTGASTINPIDGSNCHPSNFLGVRTNLINGPSVDTSGVDFQANYRFGLGETDVNLGVEGSYLIEYNRGSLVTLDGITIATALDRAGQLDLLSAFFSYPRWKTNAFVNFANGPHNLRAAVRYVSPMEDRNHDANTTVAGLQPAFVGAYVEMDLVYRVALPWRTNLTLQVQNVFDEEPSFAYSQYNYNYTQGNPLGRVIGVGIRKQF